jgi:hypothetical protein
MAAMMRCASERMTRYVQAAHVAAVRYRDMIARIARWRWLGLAKNSDVAAAGSQWRGAALSVATTSQTSAHRELQAQLRVFTARLE